MKRIIYTIYVIAILQAALIAGCSGKSDNMRLLDHADSIMEDHPDSALTILQALDTASLRKGEEKARYALLLSIALDKNYIDTTSFDILQPAIDYYKVNGSPDDRLNMYYYKGRIFQNRGELDRAINSFAKALEETNECRDSAIICRTLVAQGLIFNDLYDFVKSADNYLDAARIYRCLSESDLEYECLLYALNEAITMGNKLLADSIIALCDLKSDIPNVHKDKYVEYMITYGVKFHLKDLLNDLVDSTKNTYPTNTNSMLNLASANIELNEADKALLILDSIRECGEDYDTLKYYGLSVIALEETGKYEEALYAYYDFNRINDSLRDLTSKQMVRSVNEKHQLEMNAKIESYEKSKTIFWYITCTAVLVLCLLILLLLVRSHKIQKELAVRKAREKEMENEKLITYNASLISESAKKENRIETLKCRIGYLEEECVCLKNIICDRQELPLEVRKAIQDRIMLLNSLFARYITDNVRYSRPFDEVAKDITEKTEDFMNSTRLAFKGAHPNFIRHFEESGLTTEEINYVCLYAIGLKGVEVGKYMRKSGHVNISSIIRKKLGLDVHDTNIGIYIRGILKKYE